MPLEHQLGTKETVGALKVGTGETVGASWVPDRVLNPPSEGLVLTHMEGSGVAEVQGEGTEDTVIPTEGEWEKESDKEALEDGDTPPTKDPEGGSLTVGRAEAAEEALEVTVPVSLCAAEGVKKEVTEGALEADPSAECVPPIAEALALPEEEEHPELEGVVEAERV